MRIHRGFFKHLMQTLVFYYITSFISFAQATAKGFVLIQTKEVSMRPEDVKRVFQNSAEDLVEWITKGSFLFFCYAVVALKYLLGCSETVCLILSDKVVFISLQLVHTCIYMCTYYSRAECNKRCLKLSKLTNQVCL